MPDGGMVCFTAAAIDLRDGPAAARRRWILEQRHEALPLQVRPDWFPRRGFMPVLFRPSSSLRLELLRGNLTSAHVNFETVTVVE